MKGKVEALLTELGFNLTRVPDAHLCCGSAGTYSILQPKISQQLLKNKIAALHSGKPAAIICARVSGSNSFTAFSVSSTRTPPRKVSRELSRTVACA